MRIPLRIQELSAALLVVGLLAISISTVSGQESTTRGFNLGVHLQGASLIVGDAEGESGGGLGVRLGYGINRIIDLYFEADGICGGFEEFRGCSRVSGLWLTCDLGARFHFANTLRSWVPYLDAAIGGRVASVKQRRGGRTKMSEPSSSTVGRSPWGRPIGLSSKRTWPWT